MTRENLVLKGVECYHQKGEFLVKVESLKEHFPNAEFQKSDVKEIEDVEFVDPKDVVFGEAVEIEKTDRSHAMTAEEVRLSPMTPDECFSVADAIHVTGSEDFSNASWDGAKEEAPKVEKPKAEKKAPKKKAEPKA